MNMIHRIKRLESQNVPIEPLTDDEQRRLKQLSEMDNNHPDYDVMEALALLLRSRPGLTYEHWLQEAMEP